jgi:hypothetical protein
MRSMLVQGPWKRYKRYSDNVKLEARLVQMGDHKLMQVKESREGNFTCPCCSALISQGNAKAFPQVLLEPKSFHERHRPLDTD